MELDKGNTVEPAVKEKPERRKKRIWSVFVQPLLIAGCLFFWLVFTPMGQLVHVVVWWKTVTVQEANVYFAVMSAAAALISLMLSRRTPRAEG
ncbi:hypothetical protein ACFFNY_05865 [Paenibacillus hodogayensis]|uniref:Uncharacterized protein n=1 Tax=Paenibacillus hodogayensis TaxID=279208 RepID=A0ABV5VS45_9BACL